MVNLGDTIGKMVEEIVEDEATFLVDVEIKGDKNQPKVIVRIDGDQGVNIDTCARISRKLANGIEEIDLIDTRYNLEVTSPGLDQPITILRQYQKNIGRKIHLQLKEGEELKGKLLEAGAEKLRIASEILAKNKKNKKIEERVIAFEDIKIANVIISFK